MPLFYSYQAYLGRYKVKTLSYGLRCIVWWELSLIMASFLWKALRCLKERFVFKALAIQWSKPVPRKWRGPVISQLYMCWVDFSYQSHDWLVVCFTFKLGCPFFYTGSLVFRFSWFFFWIAGAEDGFYHLFFLCCSAPIVHFLFISAVDIYV